jgi:hypothetical protein
MVRKTEAQQLCGKPRCNSAFKTLKAHFALGKYHPSSSAVSEARNPHEMGTSLRLKSGRGWRIVAGPELTERELHIATVGWKPEKRRPGKSVPVNIVGGYRFPGAADIKLEVIPLSDVTSLAPSHVRSPPLAPGEGEGLDIPAFLTKI